MHSLETTVVSLALTWGRRKIDETIDTTSGLG